MGGWNWGREGKGGAIEHDAALEEQHIALGTSRSLTCWEKGGGFPLCHAVDGLTRMLHSRQ